MSTDINRAKLAAKGGKVAPPFAVDLMEPMYDYRATDLTRTDDQRTDQQAIKEGVNDPVIAQAVSTAKQVPSPSANGSEFQPKQPFSNLDRDMGTGFPRRVRGDAQTPEAGDLITGAKGAPSPDATVEGV